MNHFKT